jgi:hypothetical protein
MSKLAIELGWASKDELGDLSSTACRWGEQPDVLDAIIWCESIHSDVQI